MDQVASKILARLDLHVSYGVFGLTTRKLQLKCAAGIGINTDNVYQGSVIYYENKRPRSVETDICCSDILDPHTAPLTCSPAICMCRDHGRSARSTRCITDKCRERAIIRECALEYGDVSPIVVVPLGTNSNSPGWLGFIEVAVHMQLPNHIIFEPESLELVRVFGMPRGLYSIRKPIVSVVIQLFYFTVNNVIHCWAFLHAALK